jgi:myo-inositol-1(or 4)-monophosphatase
MAAGVIIAREAGATIVDKDGSHHNLQSRATVGAGPRLIEPVLRLIEGARATVLDRAST